MTKDRTWNDKERQAIPVIGKKPTRDDLTKAIEAARDAANAAAEVAEATLPTLEDADAHPTEAKVVRPHLQGLRKHEGPAAFDQFMAALRDPLKRAGDKVKVSSNAGWIKIEGAANGHKVYIAKTKTGISRIESTLDADLITGAIPYEGSNGRIASSLPPETEAVTEAIQLLVSLAEHIRPPARPRQDGESS